MATIARRRWLPRFSLRTLLYAVLLIGSTTTLWWHWKPWALQRTLRGHANSVRSASFSPDGRRIVTASFDGTARVWDSETGRLLTKHNGSQDIVQFAAFSPDGRRIVTSDDDTAVVWDA